MEVKPRLTDAELVILEVGQGLRDFTSEAHWLRHSHAHPGHLFHYPPPRSGYNTRLRAPRFVR